MVYRGHVENGKVIVDGAGVLPDGATVEIHVIGGAASLQSADSEPTLLERLRTVVGAARGLPPDASVNVDHYLYGHDKR